MKNILKISGFLALLMVLFVSCEKDNITTTVEELVGTEKQMEADLKQTLGKSANGWVMMVKSTLAETAYVPVVMQFDTIKNMVKMRSVYGSAVSNQSTYLINKGVSGVLLNFSGGSAVSSLMRMDRKYGDVTDYVFKVLSVGAESIKIQCLKSGEAYKKEGGPIYTLFKRPENWKWADDALLLDLKKTEARANVISTNSVLTLNYIPTGEKVSIGSHFGPGFDGVLNSWQLNGDPFYSNASANVFDKFYLFYAYVNYSKGTISDDYEDYPVARQGHNALYFIPFYERDANTWASTDKFAKSIKTPYLVINEVIRTGTNVTIKVASYDKSGKEYITGEYRNFN
ncbi:DUF4302 domain-containing protein [Pedobacter caeni]|uniref:DUF4302 domain-containing protein n=1 Tax=Pedobacter caeni TaxID=288992 RepID=A0A1M5BLY3_9SPHI|nr:DUF4302 domain-containing protein [Pedobacter caeni]SHF43400.1 protein of unknown function [Pedobacter caeni]